ncbi:hypothetical protein BLA29_011669 [Euroglyphus maynei]|uniref:Uncharacterized protein n=1 Tax=Euroglyphus maynei TaxID=6958 RepID=A0A1Y3B151_EURMA|nr:hypothetical protein BLA29_011669 [Euroglyphus maynei]
MPKYVRNDAVGALIENQNKCRLARVRSNPSCRRNVTRPNAAGALCNNMAKKTIISTSACDVVAAAPNAIPSAVQNKQNKK